MRARLALLLLLAAAAPVRAGGDEDVKKQDTSLGAGGMVSSALMQGAAGAAQGYQGAAQIAGSQAAQTRYAAKEPAQRSFDQGKVFQDGGNVDQPLQKQLSEDLLEKVDYHEHVLHGKPTGVNTTPPAQLTTLTPLPEFKGQALPYLGGSDLGPRIGDDPGATPAEQRASQQAFTQRLAAQAAQAEQGGDPGRAALLSSYAGRPQDAERLAQKALAQNPADKQALTALMLARQNQGRTDEARALAQRALAADPQNPLAKMIAGHGESLSRGEALEKKLSKLDLGKTAETDGAGAAGAGLFGERGAGLGAQPGVAGSGPKAAAAIAGGSAAGAPHPPATIYEGAQPLTPAQQLVIKAVRKHEIGDEQGAMLALTAAIDRDPKDAGAFVVRAEVDNSLTKYAEAVIDATRAVDLAPTKPVLGARALRARAYAHLELKDWVSALADASGAVDQDPRSGLAYLYRAMAEDKLGRGTAASSDVSQAVTLDPALAPLARPLMTKYGLQPAPAAPSRNRSWPLFGAFGAVSLGLLALGSRKLFASAPRLTTTAAQRLRESTPTP